MQRRRLLTVLPALALGAAMLGPFWNKAFTIDDPFFLAQARHVLDAPLDPMDFEFFWMSQRFQVKNLAVNGPTLAYVLAPVVWLGAPEWAAHATVVAFLALGLVGFVALARRLGLEPDEAGWAAALLVSTPAVLGMAGTIMPDVPAMAVGVWALERCAAYRDEGRWQQGVSASLLIVLAATFRVHTVLLAGVGAALLIGEPLLGRARSIGWLRLWPVGAGVALAAALALGSPAGAAIARLAFWTWVPNNAVAFFTHWVLVVPLAVPWLVVRGRSAPWWLVPVAAVLAGWVLWRSEELSWWWAIPMAAAGATALLDVALDAWRRRDVVQLALGLWLGIALAALGYHHLPAKFVLVSAPAAALLLVRVSRALSPQARVWLRGGVVAAGSVLGLLILAADARHGDVGRRAAAELIAPLVAEGHTVWYSGDWGFHEYAERAGARPLAPYAPARPGDFIVANLVYHPLRNAERFEVSRVDRLQVDGPAGRVLGDGAGFFSNNLGYLPWRWSSLPVDRYDVLQILPRRDP